MKLIDFYKYEKLTNLLVTMGAELVQFKVDNTWETINDEKLSQLLNTGELEISIDEIEISDGVLEYKGKKIIAYIRDQIVTKQSLARGNTKYKFHITNCTTINKAINNNRKSRYLISLRTDGIFKINLFDQENNPIVKDKITKLEVCINCLKQVNYKKYRHLDKYSQSIIYNNFNLEEYFEKYKHSTLNEGTFRKSEEAPINQYPKDFKKISIEYRKSKNYICEECSINLSKKEHQKFLHTHHKNGDKSNNKLSNLEALCIECHSNKLNHEHIKNKNEYIEFIFMKSNNEFNIK